eukprot:UN03597
MLSQYHSIFNQMLTILKQAMISVTTTTTTTTTPPDFIYQVSELATSNILNSNSNQQGEQFVQCISRIETLLTMLTNVPIHMLHNCFQSQHGLAQWLPVMLLFLNSLFGGQFTNLVHKISLDLFTVRFDSSNVQNNNNKTNLKIQNKNSIGILLSIPEAFTQSLLRLTQFKTDN